MTMWAKPGVKCVCVKERVGFDPRGVIRVPALKEVLTIRGVSVLADGAVVLRFQEIRNPKVPTTEGVMERGFGIDNFRPLTTRTQEQDLELFRPLLAPNPVDAGLVPAGVELDA